MPRDPNDPRDYGLPESRPIAAPVFVKLHQAPLDGSQPECPRCGCVTLCEIEIQVEQKLVHGARGIGRYLSCAACPWASPMIVKAAPTTAVEA